MEVYDDVLQATSNLSDNVVERIMDNLNTKQPVFDHMRVAHVNDRPRAECVTASSFILSVEGRLAAELIRGLVLPETAHTKSPTELAERACDCAEAFVGEIIKRGWVKELPSFEDLFAVEQEFLDKKNAEKEERLKAAKET